MSYGVYHTDMIVLAITPRDEANAVFTLLTRELGLIRAKAQSIRTITSKLRFSLQYLSKGTVDVIRAKDYWRIVGAEAEDTIVPTEIRHTSLHNIAKLITRIVPQDENLADVYEVMNEAHTMFKQREYAIDHQHSAIIEVITVARILSLVGYWNETLPTYLESLALSDEQLDRIVIRKKEYLAAINAALRESHL